MERILTERESEVLKALVEEYIFTGKPVGSRSFVNKYSFSISPATMRNIMCDLENFGYLHQPHISAGRVPLYKGFRYYVDKLLESYNGITEKPNVKDDVLQREIQYDKLFDSIAKMLSSVSNYAGVVLTPNNDYMVIKNVELVPLTTNDIMVVLVTRTGIVINSRASISQALSQDDLHKFSKYLTTELSGYSLFALKEKHLDKMRKKISNSMEYQLAIDIIQIGLSTTEEPSVYIEGIEKILHIPDMIEKEVLDGFLHLIEDKRSTANILKEELNSERVSIKIGDEISDNNVVGCSFVTKSYKIGNKQVGVVGVIGPVRMDYKKVVPLVDYTGRVVSDLLTKMSQ